MHIVLTLLKALYLRPHSNQIKVRLNHIKQDLLPYPENRLWLIAHFCLHHIPLSYGCDNHGAWHIVPVISSFELKNHSSL